ncbi:CBS domain-containing protein [Halalkalibacillus halophilus]|uniref:CBS domain-containing protein n=1 Tax=Halalkalibacillus halophilus TaxID=392827 RepID=UPI00040338C9|nr:CBS domain-containing protein [Halalkalibacillus halophilus]
MNQQIRELMANNVLSVTPNQTVQEAATLMAQHDIGAIPVVENGELRGILTDRDITLRATAQGFQADCPIGNCMSDQLTTCEAGMDVHQAAQIMAQHQVRRLPIVENGQLVGMLSIGDLARQDIYRNEAGEALSNISNPGVNLQG